MDEVMELVVTPFQEIVRKGTTAVANADSSQSMRSIAQSLVKEGERALNHLEPLCKKLLDDYGLQFVDAIKENDDIGIYRSDLTDLLWEFDDYTELDGFNAEKYAELQALSRTAAPRIYDILMRMKLECPPRDHSSQLYLSQLSPPSSPLPLPGLDALRSSALQPPRMSVAAALHRRPATPPQARLATSSSSASLAEGSGVFADLTPARRRLRRPVTADDANGPFPHNPSRLTTMIKSMHPVLATNANWSAGCVLFPDDDVAACDEERQGDARSAAQRPESPVDPAISPLSPAQFRQPSTFGSRTASSADDWSENDHDDRLTSSSNSTYSMPSSPNHVYRTRNFTLGASIPEHGVIGDRLTKELPALPHNRFPHPASTYSHRFARTLSGSCCDQAQAPHDFDEAAQQHLRHGGRDPRATGALPLQIPPHPESAPHRKQHPPLPRSRPSSPNLSQPGLEVPAPNLPTTEVDPGLIPVEPPYYPQLKKKSVDARPRECSIGAQSSFHVYHGFCSGAKEILHGRNCVKKVQKSARRTLSRVAARCVGCQYELDYHDLEVDLSKQEAGNLTKCGIGLRVRFLQKSHLPAKRADDVQYACLFCVHQGRTLDPSDATVFFSTKALFNHLARHPRPLPQVPGVVVVDQDEVPKSLRNNYDLHFKHPPVPHPAQQLDAETAGRPTGIAKKQARKLHGQRAVLDRTPTLEMAEGARITGIKWPPKYHGEWIFAWHDGTFAATQTDTIKLEPPPAGEIRLGGTSQVRAKAKWKFAPKEKDGGGWLRFDKNETIINIRWACVEHWCWAGQNARGKWGIFPQAFIDVKSLTELTDDVIDQATAELPSPSRTSSVLAKLSGRRPSGGGSSTTGSTSSHDTVHPGFRLSLGSSRRHRRGDF